MAPQVLPSAAGNGIHLEHARTQAVEHAHGREAGKQTKAVADDPEGFRREPPECVVDRNRGRRLVRAHDPGDRVAVGRPGRVDGVQVVGGREERLTNDGILEDVEQIGRVAPRFVDGRRGDLFAETPPGRDSIPT